MKKTAKTGTSAIRILAALLAALMLCGCFSGCGRTPDDTDEEEIVRKDKDKKKKDKEDKPDEPADESSEAAEPSEPAEKWDGEHFARGHVKDDCYTNVMLGLSFPKPSASYTMYSDDQIAQLNGYRDADYTEEIQNQLDDTPVIYDMYILDLVGDSVNINFENTILTAMGDITESEYIAAGEELLAEQLAASGMTVDAVERITLSLCGVSHEALQLTVTMNGIAMHEVLTAVKCGKYMGVITVASQDEEIIWELINNFRPL